MPENNKSEERCTHHELYFRSEFEAICGICEGKLNSIDAFNLILNRIRELESMNREIHKEKIEFPHRMVHEDAPSV